MLRKFAVKILQICPPHMSDVATLPWEVQKVIFNSIVHTHFWLFMLSQKKANCNALVYLPENVTTLTCELQNFFIWLKVRCVLTNVGGSEKSQLWVVVDCSEKNRLWCGWQLECQEAMSHQLFRVTTFCFNTCFQSFLILFGRIVHHAEVKFSPCRKAAVQQLLFVFFCHGYLTDLSLHLSDVATLPWEIEKSHF